MNAVKRGIERGHHDHRQNAVFRIGANLFADIVAADARHHDIKQHQIGLDTGDFRQTFFAGRGSSRDVALSRQ